MSPSTPNRNPDYWPYDEETELGFEFAHHVASLSDADWRDVRKDMDRRFSGFFCSNLMDCTLPWRGAHQLAALYLFELDPAIKSIEVMPERLTFIIDGERRKWIPAWRLRCGPRTVMVDVLQQRWKGAHKAREAVTRALTAAYAARGVTYRAISDTSIMAEPRRGNARYVLSYRGAVPSADLEISVIGILAEEGSHTLGSLTDRLGGRPEARETILWMVTRRKLTVGLGAITKDEMPISLPARGVRP